MSLGASGVQIASRFVATDECDADIKYKQAYINAEDKDVIILKNLSATAKKGGCGKCQASCQSACKTSCTVGNQKCANDDNK